MIQLNLLPDVKLEFIRVQRRKRLVYGVSAIVSAAAVAVFVLLFLFVAVVQKQHISAVNKDIDASVGKLQSVPDLGKILTIQSQLANLPTLHNDKKISSRTFDYLKQLTPTEATIAEVKLDFDANTLNIKGNAKSLRTINKFADTLKFTTFKVSGTAPPEGEDKAFSNVVLKNFQVSQGQGDGIVYELEMNFAAAIYANSAPNTEDKSPVELIVPQIVSTRSATQTPNSLFAPSGSKEE